MGKDNGKDRIRSNRVKPFWRRLWGTRVILKLRDGTEVEGILRGILRHFIKLENVLEVGRNYRVSAGWVVIDSAGVVRIYPANADFDYHG